VIAKIKKAVRLAGMRPMPRWRDRMPVPLRHKRILLTGASSGISALAAEKLAAEGATVIAVARRKHLLERETNQMNSMACSGDMVTVSETAFSEVPDSSPVEGLRL
jgi:hypothetical protein